MDFELSDKHKDLKSRIHEIVAETVDHEVVEETHRTGTNHSPALAKALGDAGLLEQTMPGDGQDPLAMWLLSTEAEKLGAPVDAITMATMIAGVVHTVGSDFLKEKVAGLLTGEELVCFGLTEPDGGSDLPAIKTRATPDGDDWIISGAKMWTTMAHVADWVFLLTRTDTSGGRNAGFTVFLVPMSSPGVSVDPIWTVSTERSNATFYDDVRIGSEWIIGEPHEGWKVLSVMLGFERGMGNTSFMTPLLRRFAEWATEAGRIGDPILREHMAQLAIDAQVSELLTQRTVWTAATGRPPGTEGSIAKVFASEAYQRHARWAQAAAAPEGLLGFGAPGAAADGWIDYDVRHAIPQRLQGGTTEINNNNIATRHMGLPRK